MGGCGCGRGVFSLCFATWSLNQGSEESFTEKVTMYKNPLEGSKWNLQGKQKVTDKCSIERLYLECWKSLESLGA